MDHAKQEAIEIIQNLRDDRSLTDILAVLHFKQNVDDGIADADAGRSISHQERRTRAALWAKSVGLQ